MHYNGSREGADETARLITDAGGAGGVDAGGSRRDSTPRMRSSTVPSRGGGTLDVLVNSAAIMLRTPVGDDGGADWDTMFALNVRAPFFLSQRAAPALARIAAGRSSTSPTSPRSRRGRRTCRTG